MNALVQGLAALGGLRDRDTLDTELVRLVVRHAGLGVTRADLIRVLGDGDGLNGGLPVIFKCQRVNGLVACMTRRRLGQSDGHVQAPCFLR